MAPVSSIVTHTSLILACCGWRTAWATHDLRIIMLIKMKAWPLCRISPCLKCDVFSLSRAVLVLKSVLGVRAWVSGVVYLAYTTLILL